MMKNVFIAFLCMFASIAYAQQDTMVSYHDSTGFDYVDSSKIIQGSPSGRSNYF